MSGCVAEALSTADNIMTFRTARLWQLLADPELCDRLGESAAGRAATFGWMQTARAHLEAYELVAHAAARQARVREGRPQLV